MRCRGDSRCGGTMGGTAASGRGGMRGCGMRADAGGRAQRERGRDARLRDAGGCGMRCGCGMRAAERASRGVWTPTLLT